MKHNPWPSAATVHPLDPTLESSLACKLTGLLGGPGAAKKLLEQCLEGTGSPYYDPVERRDRKSPVTAVEESCRCHLHAKAPIHPRPVIKVRALEGMTQNHFQR